MHPTQEHLICEANLDGHKGETDSNTVIVGDFNTPLTSMDRFSRQKINKETAALNNTLDQMDLIGIFRAFHHKTAGYTYFSSAHGTFSRIDHMLGHKTSLNKFKKIEIMSSIFSDHNAMKLEINRKRNTEKYTKTWKLNNMLLNNGSTTRSREKSKDTLAQMKMRTHHIKICGTQGKKSSEGNSQHHGPISQIQEKAQINNLTLYLKELEKEQQIKPT